MTAQCERLLSFADELRDAGKLCATIARAKMSEFISRGLIPRAKDDTATVTFIELDGRTYAVTAHHVIRGFQAQAEADGVAAEGYFLPAEPGVWIEPPFVRPPAHYPHPQPDVALRPIDRSKLPTGKRFHRLARLSPTFPIQYALAAGFPTAAKETLPALGGERLKLVGVHAIAEGVDSSAGSDQVQFYSEVKREKISGDVSGMSGGPIFWSDGNAYGLLGFVKEAMGEQSGNDEIARVHFICQRADYDVFASWASYADKAVPKERAALNARLSTGAAQRGSSS